MLFKYPEKMRELVYLDSRARVILHVYAYLAKVLYSDLIVITKIWAPDKGSPHYWHRAIDVAILEQGGITGSELLRTAINLLFPYGLKSDGKPGETIPPLRHGTAPHTHIQVRGT